MAILLNLERNNLQDELIRFHKKIFTLLTFTFAKRGIQCNITHPTATARQCLLSTQGGSTRPTLFTIQLNGAPACLILLLCLPKYAITVCR